MTRPFMQQFHCQNCKTVQTVETLFSRWIRNHPELSSKEGFSITDQDFWIHKFKTNGSREFQLIMLVEIKTLGAKLSEAQRDTLHMANQIMRTRRSTPTKEMEYQAGTTPHLQAVSTILKRKVELKSFGMHVLTFSQLGPEDSDWMTWDNKHKIDKETLASILKFDLDPDTLGDINDTLRSHHAQRELPLFSEVRKNA